MNSSPPVSVEAIVCSLLLYGLLSSVFCPSNQSSLLLPEENFHPLDHITPWISHHWDKIHTPLSSDFYLQPHLSSSSHTYPIISLYSTTFSFPNLSCISLIFRPLYKLFPLFQILFPAYWPDKFLFNMGSLSCVKTLLCSHSTLTFLYHTSYLLLQSSQPAWVLDCEFLEQTDPVFYYLKILSAQHWKLQ